MHEHEVEVLALAAQHDVVAGAVPLEGDDLHDPAARRHHRRARRRRDVLALVGMARARRPEAPVRADAVRELADQRERVPVEGEGAGGRRLRRAAQAAGREM